MGLILLAVGSLSILLSSFLLYQNRFRYNLRLDFGLLMIFAGLWGVFIGLFFLAGGNYLAINLNYVVALAMVYFLLAFTMRLDGRRSRLLRIPHVTAFILPALLAGMFLLDKTWVIASIDFVGTSDVNISINPLGYYLYAAVFSVVYTLSVFYILRALYKSLAAERKRYLQILISILITGFTGLYTNLYLPITGVYEYIWISPTLVGIVVLASGISIFKYQAFDVKLVAVRAFAYVLTITAFAAIYGALVFAVSTVLLGIDSVNFDETQRFLYIAIAVLLAFTFNPLRNYFNKQTNRLFYRDAYDPQDFLDELNSEIVQNIDMGILLRRVSSVIERHIKCSYCFINVFETNETSSKTGLELPKINKDTLLELREMLPKSRQKVVVTDELDNDQSHLKDLLTQNDIGIIVPIGGGRGKDSKTLAFLVLGLKKSGNIYSKQDIKIIEIIADELVIAIQNALRFEEIQGFAAKLQEEVNTATAKLQRTNKKLRELDETKDEFVSMASHQLRTPLTSVKGYISMVLEGDAGKISKQQRDLLNQAFVSSQRMVYLIADLLNVSRLKTGKFIIEPAPTNLAEVIEGEIGQLRETAKAKKIEIEYKKPKDFPTLALDETKIRQVIMNFSDNAIYYTPRDGKIKVELSEDKSNVYFKVIDNGLGVPKRDQPHLFTKFYRATNARKARPDGTGLGLFMAKKVIDNQGGNILFESEENKGSTFGFCFDKKKHRVKKHSS